MNSSRRLTMFVFALLTENTRQLSNDDVRSQKRVVLLRQFTHKFFVLVQFLQLVDGHRRNTVGTSFVAVTFVTENAHGEFRFRDVTETNGAAETFVSRRVEVLQNNLQFDGFDEVSFLRIFRIRQNVLRCFQQHILKERERTAFEFETNSSETYSSNFG